MVRSKWFVKQRLIHQVRLEKEVNAWFCAELEYRRKRQHKFLFWSQFISAATKQAVSIRMTCCGSMKAVTHQIVHKRETISSIRMFSWMFASIWGHIWSDHIHHEHFVNRRGSLHHYLYYITRKANDDGGVIIYQSSANKLIPNLLLMGDNYIITRALHTIKIWIAFLLPAIIIIINSGHWYI